MIEKIAKVLENRRKKRAGLCAILAILILTTLFTLPIFLPDANAHTPPISIPTWAYLSVTPNPVGVGQELFVNFFLDKAPPTANAQYGDRWHNFKVTVTTPDGITKNLPLGKAANSDAVGGSWATYIPTVAGNYTFKFSFPGQTLTGENPSRSGTSSPEFVGDYFEPSESAPVTVTVQDEKIPYLPMTPLPTGYWQRPIYSENLDWYTLGGNWLGLWQQGNGGSSYNASGNFAPYTTGPSSAHIVWTKPVAPGGLIGGEFGGNEYGSSYYQTPQYECKFRGIIINGILYYQQLPGSSTYPAGWVAVDVRTGEEVWTLNKTERMLCGQVLSYVSPNQFGGLSYLWSTETTRSPNTGSTYGLYDAMTGKWILNIVNASSLSYIMEAPDGTLLGYYVNNTDRTLRMWNSTKCILVGQTPSAYGNVSLESWQWRPVLGSSIPFYYGIQWAVPLANNISGVPISPTLSINTIGSDILLMRSSEGQSSARWQQGYEVMAGYDVWTGKLKWGPINITLNEWTRLTLSPGMQGKWFEFDHETMSWYGYDINSGTRLWGPSEPYTSPWGYYVCYPPIAAYGLLYVADFGGYVHAYDVNTGVKVWSFSTGSSGYETPYGNYPLLHLECVADGKVYVTGGHTYSPPLFRDSKMWCLNATTGEPIWNTSFFVDANQATGVIADGYLININGYDNQLYSFGKGLSATTLSTPDIAVPKGTPVLLKGTVTDQSPGQTCLGIPAAGTPAISDESMTAWMEYMYMQQPKPTNATGVKVYLAAYDSNGNFQEIGTTITDVNGKYGITWTPPIEGTYHITATFEGSNSYFSSEDTAYLAVITTTSTEPASPAPTTQAPIETPASTITPSPAINVGGASDTALYVGIAAVVIIAVIVAVALFLRKRK